MLRKALVAGVVVVVSLLTVSYFCPGAYTQFRLWLKERRQEAQDSIPPEKKIAAAKLRLEDLAKEDERHYHKVAVQIVEVQKLDKQVKAMRTRVNDEERRIVSMKASYDVAVKAEKKQVSHGGADYDLQAFHNELRTAAARFQVEEQLLKSKEEQLALRKKAVETNQAKLMERKLARQRMLTKLEQLEAELVAARHAQALEKDTINDPGYLEVAGEIDAICDGMEVMKQEALLKGKVEGSVRKTEQAKEKEAAIDRFLNERFSEKH